MDKDVFEAEPKDSKLLTKRIAVGVAVAVVVALMLAVPYYFLYGREVVVPCSEVERKVYEYLLDPEKNSDLTEKEASGLTAENWKPILKIWKAKNRLEFDEKSLESASPKEVTDFAAKVLPSSGTLKTELLEILLNLGYEKAVTRIFNVSSKTNRLLDFAKSKRHLWTCVYMSKLSREDMDLSRDQWKLDDRFSEEDFIKFIQSPLASSKVFDHFVQNKIATYHGLALVAIKQAELKHLQHFLSKIVNLNFISLLLDGLYEKYLINEKNVKCIEALFQRAKEMIKEGRLTLTSEFCTQTNDLFVKYIDSEIAHQPADSKLAKSLTEIKTSFLA